MVAFQPGPAAEVDISKIKFSTRTLTVPEVVHKLVELHDPIIKWPSYLITEQDVDNILNRNPDNPGFKSFTQAYAKGLAFNMHHQHIDRIKDVNSNWTNYNKNHRGCNDVLATSMGQMPLLNAKANEHKTINTCVERAKIIAQHLGDKYIWFVTDHTVSEIVIGFTGRTQTGIHYVAMSRVREFKKLHLLNYDPKKVKASEEVKLEINRLRQ